MLFLAACTSKSSAQAVVGARPERALGRRAAAVVRVVAPRAAVRVVAPQAAVQGVARRAAASAEPAARQEPQVPS